MSLRIYPQYPHLHHKQSVELHLRQEEDNGRAVHNKKYETWCSPFPKSNRAYDQSVCKTAQKGLHMWNLSPCSCK